MSGKRIDAHALGVLEFPAVLEALAGYAASELGRAAAGDLHPSLDEEWIAVRMGETTELKAILEKNIRVPLAGLRDIRGLLEESASGMALEPAALLEICDTLRASNNLKGFFGELELEAPRLKEMAGRLEGFEQIIGEIDRCIEGNEEIRDTASEKLAGLRRDIERLQGEIRGRIRKILSSGELQAAIENENFLIRNGRPVIAVNANYRSWIPGVVLDRSKSGATLFVEPQALGELSNELENALYEERKEVNRILWELTRLVAQQRGEIGRTVKLLGWIDLTYAKARFSVAQRMAPCSIAAGQGVKLRGARHPLLVGLAAARKGVDGREGDGLDEVVPIDVHLGEHFDLLLVTGPNTGGKTVALKTVGLTALMGQCGMHVPAAEGACMPLFRRVYADIGDEQSLAQSLSTFSAHMAQMVRILDGADHDSLVLLDELGAGTDPAEGAALGEAILDTLLEVRAKVIATTHLGALKGFASKRERAENASVDFDAETLGPTYHLRIGEPGSSNALAIVRRLRMPRAVVQRAQGLLGDDTRREHDLMQTVQKVRLAAERQRARATEQRARADQLRRAAQETLAQTERERALAVSEADQELDRSLGQVRRAARGFMKEMGSAPNVWREKAADFWGQVETIAARTPLARRRAAFVDKVRRGDYVYLTRLQRRALVLRIQRKKKTMTVTLDGREVEVPFEQVAQPPD